MHNFIKPTYNPGLKPFMLNESCQHSRLGYKPTELLITRIIIFFVT